MTMLLDIPKKHIDESVHLSALCKIYEKPVVFLPNYGEFGPVIDKLIKIIHFCKAPEKIICCKPGQEAYYPSASSFYYDWEDNIIEGQYRWGFFTKRKLAYLDNAKIKNEKLREHKSRVENDINKIKEKFGPSHEYFNSIELNTVDWRWTKDYSHLFRFKLKPLIEMGLDTDIVISPRAKKARPDNNFDWTGFVKTMSDKGFRIGLVGAKDTSELVPGYKYASWENEDNASACIELLNKCKLFVGLDTGTAHLASFIGDVPMIIFQGNNPCSSGTWIMEKMTKECFVDLGHGVATELVIQKTLEFLGKRE